MYNLVDPMYLVGEGSIYFKLLVEYIVEMHELTDVV